MFKLSVKIIFFVLLTAGYACCDFVPRNYYGAKFEPTDTILHGAGQTYYLEAQDGAFEIYAELLGQDKFPLVFMDYCNLTSGSSFYTELRARLENIKAVYDKWVIPQIGVDFTSSGQPTQTQIDSFVYKIVNVLDWPCFLRLGYEFNGTWYDPMYNPTDFKASWIAITTALQDAEAKAATVWCSYPGYYTGNYAQWAYISQFYPGDQYVDWFGIDTFSASDLTSQALNDVIANAHQHSKPVMIGEATPRFIGADDAADWSSWFVPYFDIFENNPGVKAHTYINWDWDGTNWDDWGDARLETGNETVRNNYLAVMDDPIWRHAGDKPYRQAAYCGDWGYMPADLSKDCVVDFEDLAILAANWAKCIAPEEQGCTEPWKD